MTAINPRINRQSITEDINDSSYIILQNEFFGIQNTVSQSINVNGIINQQIIGSVSFSQFAIPQTVSINGVSNNNPIGAIDITKSLQSSITGKLNNNTFGSQTIGLTLQYNVNGKENINSVGSPSITKQLIIDVNGISNSNYIGDSVITQGNSLNIIGIQSSSLFGSVLKSTSLTKQIDGLQNNDTGVHPNSMGDVNVSLQLISSIIGTNNSNIILPPTITSNISSNVIGVYNNENIGITDIIKSLNVNCIGTQNNSSLAMPNIETNTINNVVGLYNISQFETITILNQQIETVVGVSNINELGIPNIPLNIAVSGYDNVIDIGDTGYVLDYNSNIIGITNVVNIGIIKAIRAELIFVENVKVNYINPYVSLSNIEKIANCLLINTGSFIILVEGKTVPTYSSEPIVKVSYLDKVV